MHKNKQFTKGVAFAAAVALAGMSLSACQSGAADKGSDNSVSKSSENTEAPASEEKAMGRYLEETISIPEDAGSIRKFKILDSGVYRILYENKDFTLCMAESQDQGKTWSEGKPAAELLGLEKSGYYFPASALASDGGIFFTGYPSSENQEEALPNRYFYLSPEGEIRELDLSDSLKDDYIFVSDFTAKNTILLQPISNGIMEFDTDGTLLNHYEKGGHSECFGTSGKYLTVTIDGTVHYYNLETGKPVDNMDALTTQMSSNPGNLELTNTSTVPFAFTDGDDEKSLFYVDSTGLYRYAEGGNTVEQLIDGSLNSISSPATGFTGLERDNDGNFYLTGVDYSSESASRGFIYKYTYDPNTSAVPGTELKIYTLNESSLLKQAATVFQKKYPDIYLNIQTGMSGDDSFTSSDAVKVLNTEIMAGKGPDLLLLDGLPEDTYIEKGLLEDISGLFSEAELLDNIKDAYTGEDGKIYAMPVKFAIPLLQGKKEDIDSVTDLTSLADLAEAHKDEYEAFRLFSYSTMSPGLLLKCLTDVNMPAWLKEDGTLDGDAVASFLEDSNRIYQTSADIVKELIAEYGEDSFSSLSSEYSRHNMGIGGSALSVLGGNSQAEFGGLFSPSELSYVDSANKADSSLGVKLWDGQSKNTFYPEQIIGISAKSSNKEAAQKFLSFLFSEEGQKIGAEVGLPVNRTIYEDVNYWTQGTPGKAIGLTSTGNNQTGEYTELEICLPSEETVKEIIALGKTLTVPSKDNAIIQNAVLDAGTRYINGELSLEEAVNAVTQEVNLYLSE